jgi:integrase
LLESRQKLTVRSVEAAAVGFTWDSVLPGFGLRVLESGRRSFVVRYRTHTGTGRLLTLGTSEELHPEEAREMAREAFKAVRAGGDPKADRTRRRQAARLEELRDRFMAEHAAQKRKGTARNYEIAWRLHVLPALGNPAVADIAQADLLRLHRKLAPRPTNCNRVFEMLRVAFRLAEKWGMRPRHSNPCEDIEDFPEAPRETLLEPDEVARLWAELDSPRWMPSFATLVRLLLLTGCRCGEWRRSLWSWVDLPNARLRIPHEGSKTGARDVPLPPEVVELLAALPRTSLFVLPGRDGGPVEGHQRMWRNLKAAARIRPEVRLHDIRHTVGSLAHRAGASQREVADLLGHRQMATAARYIHGPQSEKHRNAARASGAILSIVRSDEDRRPKPSEAQA